MGQYDYVGTAETRMYDWLVTRQGDSLSLCIEDALNEIELKDLNYIRGLVERDRNQTVSPSWHKSPDFSPDDELTERDPDAPAPATGGLDYYDMVNEKGEKIHGLPDALGVAPSPTRRELDKDGRWQEVE